MMVASLAPKGVPEAVSDGLCADGLVGEGLVGEGLVGQHWSTLAIGQRWSIQVIGQHWPLAFDHWWWWQHNSNVLSLVNFKILRIFLEIEKFEISRPGLAHPREHLIQVEEYILHF